MRFDDRLTTVLNQPARTRHDKAVRWRQLVDLVARAGSGARGAALDRAIETVRSEAELVEETLRAAAARSVAALPLPVELVTIFASDTLAVSAPVLATAALDETDWRTVMAAADAETRAFIATLHPEVGATTDDEADALVLTDVVALPPPPPPPPQPQLPAEPAPTTASLADVVARIERRKSRPAAARDHGLAAQNLGLFRWESGPGGDLEWIEGVPRGALIGASIAARRGAANTGPDDHIIRAFARRSPFRDAAFVVPGKGQVSGEWKLSGVPAFDPADGRFAGYRGIAMRDQPAAVVRPAMSALEATMSDPASLRELVHEIKTPLNAIIGFAEIIDGQYLGPADRRYRQRAAHIVRQARLLLGAIDDLDFAAKAQAQAGPATVDLGMLVDDLINELRAQARLSGADIDRARSVKRVEAKISPALATRAIRSVAMGVIEQAGRGERLRISIDRVGDRPRVGISRPRALDGMSDELLFGARASQGGDDGEPQPGIGFSLRLARGLARIAGITLNAGNRDIALLFDPA